MCSVEHTGRRKLRTHRTRHARSSTWLTRSQTNWKPQTPDLTANGSSKRPRSTNHEHHHPTTHTRAPNRGRKLRRSGTADRRPTHLRTADHVRARPVAAPRPPADPAGRPPDPPP